MYIKSFATGNILLCGRDLKLLYYWLINIAVYIRGNISSRFSNNSEAKASELLENFEKNVSHY